MKCILVILLVQVLIKSTRGQDNVYSFSYVQPQNCLTDLYFNTATFQCEACRIPGSQPAPDKLSCVCQPNYKRSDQAVPAIGSTSVAQQLFSCTECAADQEVSRDGTECINSASCSATESTVERSPDGTPYANSTCQTCIAGTSDSGLTSNSPCTYCPLCTCSQVKDSVCIDPRIEPDQYLSDRYWWMRTTGLAAFYGCRTQTPNVTACQVLSNLCAMTIYSQTSSACKDYADLYSLALADNSAVEPRVTDLPWLYYVGTVAASAILSGNLITLADIPTVYSFKDGGEQELDILAGVYQANGEFLGFREIKSSNILQVCPDTTEKKQAAFRFGTKYVSSCQVSAASLWDNSTYPAYYYELFLRFKDKAGLENLYPLPIHILNLEESTQTLVYVRRFSVVDNLYGIEIEGNNASFVRAATKIKLELRLRDDESSGRIYLPKLVVTYSDISVDRQGDQITFNFEVEYSQFSSSQSTVLIVLLTSSAVIALIWSFFRMSGWRRREGLTYIDGKSFFMFFVVCFGNLSNAFFGVMWSYCFIRLIVFKGQDVVTVGPPDNELIVNQIVFISTAFAFKTVEYLAMILRQSSIDIFLIDWEKSPEKGGSTASVWRTYFIANEWNELQTVRKISLGMQMLIVILILEVMGFKDLALETPAAGVGYTQSNNVYPGVYSTPLRFALLAFVYVLVDLSQVIFNFVWKRLVEDQIADFVDLCSVSNISVITFTESQHGYYIHGRSVHGKAESDMREMAVNLNKETENLVGSRGLENGSSLQTFQITVPFVFRAQFNRIYSQLNAASGIPSGAGKKRFKFAKNIEANSAAYCNLRNYFISFLDHSFRDLDYYIKDKLFFETFLDMEFQESNDSAVLYNDPDEHFSDQFFYGQEWILMSFEILLMSVIDYGSQDFILAAFITYIVQKFLAFVRAKMGRNNLVRKTLVDERFLI